MQKFSLKRRRQWFLFFLFLALCNVFFFLIDAEIRLEAGRAPRKESSPVVSVGFNGSTHRIGKKTVLLGSLPFTIQQLPEADAGVVTSVSLHKMVNGVRVSSRRIYAPWYNILYSARNHTNSIDCTPNIFSVVSRGDVLTYRVEVLTKDGTMYQTLAFSLSAAPEEDILRTNLQTDVYNAEGILDNTILPQPKAPAVQP